MSYLVRRAAPEDAGGVAAVARRTWAATYQGIIPEAIQRQVLDQWYAEARLVQAAINPSGVFLVATDGAGHIVGFAGAWPRAETGDAELGRFYVLPEHQGKGVGRRLFTAVVEALAIIQPMGRIFVQVEAENQTGRRAYEGLGFTYVREYDDELFEHESRMVEMCVRLAAAAKDECC